MPNPVRNQQKVKFFPHFLWFRSQSLSLTAPSLKALDVGDVLLVLAASQWAVWRSVFCTSLMCSAPTPPDSAWVLSRRPLGSSSSWYALLNMIVMSIGDSCCSFRGSPSHGCRFSDILAHQVTEQKVFAPRRSRRHPAENEKTCRNEKRENTKLYEESVRTRQGFFVFSFSAMFLVPPKFLQGVFSFFSHSAGCRRGSFRTTSKFSCVFVLRVSARDFVILRALFRPSGKNYSAPGEHASRDSQLARCLGSRTLNLSEV